VSQGNAHQGAQADLESALASIALGRVRIVRRLFHLSESCSPDGPCTFERLNRLETEPMPREVLMPTATLNEDAAALRADSDALIEPSSKREPAPSTKDDDAASEIERAQESARLDYGEYERLRCAEQGFRMRSIYRDPLI
jgi:hypothetical protein